MSPQKPITFQSTCQAIRSGEFVEWEEEDQTLGAQLQEQWTGETPIVWAIQWNDLIPKIPARFLTEEILLREVPNETGAIPDPPVPREIDRLILSGAFVLFDPSVWTSELLRAPRRDDGITALHLLAEKELLSKVPNSLLTEEAVHTKAKWGLTPLRIAFEHNTFQIPAHLLTEKNIRKAFEDEWPGSVCHCLGKEAYQLGHPHSRKVLFETLPKRTFRLETLKEFRDYCQNYCTKKKFGIHLSAVQETFTWAEKEIRKELQRTALEDSLAKCRHLDL